ncbi:porin [Tropicimonas isoalkanivorans]|uniref:Outer membrane protein OmpU n=1 Tax=Tropicimonas isoalkanivorans TaxID=441112 RepID=A0A1I1L4D4_9RHOB|nr:porin [Tropicimonas isoalkanivorans]SFC64460.1 outer membrane protein OmpU [Tropicimonas isoalkanivorans]
MKKVLLTSTALVAFAGAAAAEVTLSGWAEMGVVGGKDVESQFWNDVDVDFTMTGEADNGLTFGANVDLDSASDLGNHTGEMEDVEIFLSGEFGTVTMGDTDGALDWALTDAADWGNPGTIDDSETAHWGRQDTYLDGIYDGQIFRYDYTYGDFGFALSLETDDRSDTVLETEFGDVDRNDLAWAIGAKWTPELGAGTLKLGIGYQEGDQGSVGFGLTDAQVDQLSNEFASAFFDLDPLTLTEQEAGFIEAFDGVFGFDANTGESDELLVALGDDVSVAGISAGYEMDNGFSFGGSYSDWSGDDLDSGSFWGIGAGYAWEAFSISVNYGEHSFEYEGGSGLDTSGYGVAMGYDLGGGLSILAGYGKSEADLKIKGSFLGYDPILEEFTDTVYDVNETFDTEFDTWSLGLKMDF